MFYTALSNSILQNPFTSIDDVIPENRLQAFDEFACYPSCSSSLHQFEVLKDDGRITQAFEKEMPFFNDAFGENMWTMIMKMETFPG